MEQSQLIEYEPDGATCPECGGTYSGRQGLSKHFSAQHGEKFKPLAACDNCGVLYTENRGNIANSPNTYCSAECRKEGHKGREPANKNREERECKQCGGSFSATVNSPKKYCSRNCYHSWNKENGVLRGENNPKWKADLEFECEQCGDKYTRPESHKEFTRFCSDECRSEHLTTVTGNDHWHWQGGKNYYTAIRSSLGPTGWHTQREKHLQDECEMCGSETSPGGRDLSLHHIIPVLSGGTNGEYNYLPLCEPCHSKVESTTSDIEEKHSTEFEST